MPPRITVDSSVIAAVSHSHNALQVEFRNGTVYRYFAVPAALVEALLAASSKGAFFNRHIKPRFPCQRVGV